MDSLGHFTKAFRVDAHGAKFPPLLHFIKKYKVPWIIKWQYEKEGDVLARRWYVKWWDKFSHTHKIINLVSREFPIHNALPTARIQTPAQIAELANAPTSSSTRSGKTSVKSKNKDSPLDEIRKDLDVLYAFLKAAWEKEKATEEERLLLVTLTIPMIRIFSDMMKNPLI